MEGHAHQAGLAPLEYVDLGHERNRSCLRIYPRHTTRSLRKPDRAVGTPGKIPRGVETRSERLDAQAGGGGGGARGGLLWSRTHDGRGRQRPESCHDEDGYRSRCAARSHDRFLLVVQTYSSPRICLHRKTDSAAKRLCDSAPPMCRPQARPYTASMYPAVTTRAHLIALKTRSRALS